MTDTPAGSGNLVAQSLPQFIQLMAFAPIALVCRCGATALGVAKQQSSMFDSPGVTGRAGVNVGCGVMMEVANKLAAIVGRLLLRRGKKIEPRRGLSEAPPRPQFIF